MNFEDIREFLRSEEMRISGEVIEIPVELDYWNNKTVLAEYATLEIGAYCVANELSPLKGLTFSQKVKGLKLLYPKSRDEKPFAELGVGACDSGETWPRVKFHIETLKIMLDDEYSPPFGEEMEIRYQLRAFWAYQYYTGNIIKFYFPGVNERINYAAMALLVASRMMIEDIAGRGKGLDQVQDAIGEKMSKAEKRTEIIKGLLEKYPDYKSDKDQRNNFYAEARRVTGLTTDRGVDNHVNKILGENKK